MSDRKPVRLSFPSYEPGGVDILADGKCAGFCLDEGGGAYGYGKRWRAVLYPVLRERGKARPVDCEEVTAKTLTELRAVLRERLTERGPWWKSPELALAEAEGKLAAVRELAEEWTVVDDRWGPPTPEALAEAEHGRAVLAVLDGTAA